MKPHDADPMDELLKQRARTAGPSAAAGGPLCGDAEILAAYVESSLDTESRERVMEHLAICAACREEVAALVRLAPREAIVETRSPAWWKRWMWVPALAAIVVTGSIVLTNRKEIGQPTTPQTKLVTPSQERPEVAERQPPAAKPDATLAPTTPPVIVKKKALPAGDGFAPAPATLQKDENLSLGVQDKRAEPLLQLQPGTTQDAERRDQLKAEAANAPAPAPFANNAQNQMQNAQSGLVGGSLQESTAGGGGGRGGAAGAVANRSAAAAPPPPPASPKPAEIPMFARRATVFTAQGRVEKDALEISTDGGNTWQKIVTPEPVVSVHVDDSLHFEILCKSKNVFRTKDGGKTWEQQKPPQ